MKIEQPWVDSALEGSDNEKSTLYGRVDHRISAGAEVRGDRGRGLPRQVRLSDLRLAPAPDMALENMTLALAERYLVQHALAQTGGNSDAAAEWLGLSRIAF